MAIVRKIETKYFHFNATVTYVHIFWSSVETIGIKYSIDQTHS